MKELAKIAILFAVVGFGFYLGILVMENGWGLTVKSWAWIYYGWGYIIFAALINKALE